MHRGWKFPFSADQMKKYKCLSLISIHRKSTNLKVPTCVSTFCVIMHFCVTAIPFNEKPFKINWCSFGNYGLLLKVVISENQSTQGSWRRNECEHNHVCQIWCYLIMHLWLEHYTPVIYSGLHERFRTWNLLL